MVDVISGSVESSVLPKQRKTRVFSAPVRYGANYDLERRIFGMLNEVRAENGLSPLIWDDQVAELARVHSQSMADYKFFSHKDMDGMTVDGRAESYGLTGWRGIGENIATMRGQSDPAAIAVKTWMQSPGHRQNILGGRWNDSAVGIAVANDGTYYFTQVFMLR
ncbi:MAG: CAP domain-containing protein [Acidobacteriota bacterium]